MAFDPANFLPTQELSWQAALKNSKVISDLLTVILTIG